MPLRPQSPLRFTSLMLEQHIPGRKIVQSEGDAWKDAEAQIFDRPPQEEDLLVPAVAEPLLVWIMSGEAQIEEQELAGEWTRTDAQTGSFFLTQAGAPYLMRWKTLSECPFQVLHLYLGSDLVARAACSLGLNPSRCRMRDISGAQDAFLTGLLNGLTAEMLSQPSANLLLVNGLLESLTVHLLRQYADTNTAPQRRPAQLPAWKLRKVLTYMKAHLAEPFDLDVLAAVCGMSRFHFSRSFHNTMGQSPSRWFIQVRMERAAHLLLQTDLPVIEVALTVGYESPSHFAQIFRKTTGISPRSYRAL